jgi:RNA polymerase subunit RPABC4/transcription elongation factor Spt4
MSPELINTLGTIAGIFVAALGAFLFAFWIAMGIWTFHDIRQRTRDWLVIILAVSLVLIFPLIGLILYMMIRPKATLADVYDRALEEEALLRELEQTQACHSCGVPVKDVWVYCPNCHGQLQHTCPSCGNLVRNEWEICVFCGAKQPRAAMQPQITALPQQLPTQPQITSQPAAAAGTVTTGKAFRSPFRREATPPPPPVTPPPTDVDDSSFRPARMPE